jgi:2,4-dienoyl-CoA reductase-like NADH-dependent reductase (Old Yellow Enzyme family)
VIYTNHGKVATAIKQKRGSNRMKLFESLNISNVELKNRVGLAPMTRTSATEDGLATEQIANYYAKLQKVGLVY